MEQIFNNMKNNNLSKNYFDESKKNKLLLSFYTNKNNVEKFNVGYVLETYKDSVLINSVGKYGEDDGYMLLRFVDIFQICKDSIYLKNLQLCLNENFGYDKYQITNLKLTGEQGIADIMTLCKEHKILLSIQMIYDVCLYGFILDEDNEHYLLESYTMDGNKDGNCLIKYTDIQSIGFGGNDEKKLKILIK
jgi:hypothetical protein